MQKRKIAILTQPLYNNYGGILQAYALQTVLKKMGHEVWIVDRDYNVSLLDKVLFYCKRWVKRIIKYGDNTAIPLFMLKKHREKISQNSLYFITKYMNPISEKILTTAGLVHLVERERFDAYVVGSDQVWRPIFSPCLSNYFLDFLPEENQSKKISYAASFGVDKWEFTEKETLVCRKLIQRFDAVSVREKSGINLCLNYLDTKAEFVLDPTMLLDASDYKLLVETEQEQHSSGNLMGYILDSTADKENILEYVENSLELKAFFVKPERELTNLSEKRINESIYPPITKWLRGFMDASFVITDSFHGCVFSIIFNKPFIAIANEGRGSSRFHSLLGMFNLENRLIRSSQQLTTELIKENINWGAVNQIRERLKKHSYQFIENSLLKE